MVVDEYYMSSYNQHVKNEWQYVVFHGQTSVPQQIANEDPTEKKKMYVIHCNFPFVETKASYDGFQGLEEIF